VKLDSSRGKGVTIVENLGECTQGCLTNAVGLVSGEGTQCSEQRAVKNSAGIKVVKQDPNDLLYFYLLVSGRIVLQGRGTDGWLGVLDFGTIRAGMLPSEWVFCCWGDRGHRVLERHQDSVNIALHGGDVNTVLHG
jgi:hypothetical protein